MFNRQARIAYWLNDWPEPLTAAQASQMADSEEIDYVLAEIESLAGGLQGPLLAGPLAVLKATLVQIRSQVG